MLIIDTHTHIFPDDAAARILESTSKKFKIKVHGKGTAADLISHMNENGIAYAVVHMVAINPKTVQEINTWLIGIKEPRLIKFGTIHPSAKDFKQEIHRLNKLLLVSIEMQLSVAVPLQQQVTWCIGTIPNLLDLKQQDRPLRQLEFDKKNMIKKGLIKSPFFIGRCFKNDRGL